jgi:hypothetical protein
VFNNLDDPKTQLLLAMGLGLLGGAPGQRGKGNFGADLGHAGLLGMQGYGNAQQMQMRRQEEEQQRKLRAIQIQQAERGMQEDTDIRSLASRAFAPGVTNPVQNDDEGYALPTSPAGGGLPDFARGLMGINPMKGAAFQQSLAKNTPYGKIDPKDYTPESLQSFAASGGRDFTLLRPRSKMEVSNGAVYDPYNVKPGSTVTGPLADVVPDGKGGFTFNRAKINPLEAARFDQAERHFRENQSKPQVVSGPSGDVLAVDPRAGTGRVVTGPDGQPLNKGQKPLTESQAKGALYLGMMQDSEKAIDALKFNPATIQNQTLIAFARGDIPKLPKAVQNAFAGTEAQKYTQATFQWSEAMLRQLTGANAPETEVRRNASTYFPMPGDSKEVIAQKNQARKAMQDYIKIIAGHGSEQVEQAQGQRKQDPANLRRRKEDDPLGIR